MGSALALIGLAASGRGSEPPAFAADRPLTEAERNPNVAVVCSENIAAGQLVTTDAEGYCRPVKRADRPVATAIGDHGYDYSGRPVVQARLL